MYSPLRREYFIALKSRARARARVAASGNAQTVWRPRTSGTPQRRTSRARHANANERFTCCAVIEPTSISSGDGASVGRSPWSGSTSGASAGSPFAIR